MANFLLDEEMLWQLNLSASAAVAGDGGTEDEMIPFVFLFQL